MQHLRFRASAHEVEIQIELPWTSPGSDAWERLARAFLEIALGGRSVWIADACPLPSLEWCEVIGQRAPLRLERRVSGKGHVLVEFGHSERFDERAAREIVGSADFYWDAVFLFPRDATALESAAEALERIEPAAGVAALESAGEFIASTGDGIGLRWVNPDPARDAARIAEACSAEGFTLVPFPDPDRS